MAESIESFVAKLQAQGVDAAKAAAEKVLAEAQEQARRIEAEAKAQAQKIIEQAKAQAEDLAQRERNELNLAARDTVLRLREGISQAMARLLQREASQTLSDKDFLKDLIRDLVLTYARENCRGKALMEIHVNKEAAEAITDWALDSISHTKPGENHVQVDLKENLRSKGFEYRVDESTVEVTLESVVAVLKEQVTPRMRQVLDEALAEATGSEESA